MFCLNPERIEGERETGAGPGTAYETLPRLWLSQGRILRTFLPGPGHTHWRRGVLLAAGSGGFCSSLRSPGASWAPGSLSTLCIPPPSAVFAWRHLPQWTPRFSTLPASTYSYEFLKTLLRYHPVQEDSGNMSPCPVPDSGSCMQLWSKYRLINFQTEEDTAMPLHPLYE